MSKNIDQLPSTEIVERVREIARIASENDESRARGAVNDIYARKIPAEEDWIFLLVTSSVTCTAPYTTGVASVNTQDSAVTFAGGAVIGTEMIGRRIKFNSNPDVYTLSGTGAIRPILSGDTNLSSDAFSIFQPVYALAPDFDRFPKNGGLLFYQGGRMTVIPEVKEQTYYRDYTPSPSSIPQTCRLVQAGTTSVQHIEIQPPPQKAYNFGYEYLQRPVSLRETTAGWATIDAGSTVVVGSPGFSRFTELTTGAFFRIDAFGIGADSEWYRVAAITHDSSLTLAGAFGLSGAVSAGYTLSAAPAYPVKLHPAILYGAVTFVTADQNDPTFKFYDAKYRETINDAKRTFKTRIYQQDVSLIAEEWQYRR